MTGYTAKKVILKDASGNYLIPYTENELPSQTNNSGKYLTTNGVTASWNRIETITTEQLNGKVDKSSLAIVNPMITSYRNGTSGYNIWANGFCEQWGYSTVITGNGQDTISLIKTMEDINYNIIMTADYKDTGYKTYRVHSKTTTSFIAYGYGTGSSVSGIYWIVKGYLAEGEY